MGKCAVSTFTTTVGGEEYRVIGGEVLPATHPVVKARGELFEDESGSQSKKRVPAKKRTTKRTTKK